MPARSLLCLTLAVALLSACSDRAAMTAPDKTPAASYSHDPTSGEIRARIAPKGEEPATLRSGPQVPVRLPRGFTLYPGAKVTANTVVERGDSQRVLMVFETYDPVDLVTAFYRRQARDAGFALSLDLVGEERASIGGRTARGRGFALSAQRGSLTRAELAFE